jgi:hypothetical protein
MRDIPSRTQAENRTVEVLDFISRAPAFCKIGDDLKCEWSKILNPDGMTHDRPFGRIAARAAPITPSARRREWASGWTMDHSTVHFAALHRWNWIDLRYSAVAGYSDLWR